MGRVHKTIIDPDATGHTGLKLTTAYVYDAAGRPVQTIEPEGQITATAYDTAGRLTTITDAAPTRATSAVHAGGVLAEIDDATGDRAWALRDGLGSVRARGDDAGATTDTARWDAWGEATTAPAGLFGWAGEQADAETGLTYLRARSYSPVYGRFLSRDAVSRNAPGMPGHNPAIFTDPSGMVAIGRLGATRDGRLMRPFAGACAPWRGRPGSAGACAGGTPSA